MNNSQGHRRKSLWSDSNVSDNQPQAAVPDSPAKRSRGYLDPNCSHNVKETSVISAGQILPQLPIPSLIHQNAISSISRISSMKELQRLKGTLLEHSKSSILLSSNPSDEFNSSASLDRIQTDSEESSMPSEHSTISGHSDTASDQPGSTRFANITRTAAMLESLPSIVAQQREFKCQLDAEADNHEFAKAVCNDVCASPIAGDSAITTTKIDDKLTAMQMTCDVEQLALHVGSDESLQQYPISSTHPDVSSPLASSSLKNQCQAPNLSFEFDDEYGSLESYNSEDGVRSSTDTDSNHDQITAACPLNRHAPNILRNMDDLGNPPNLTPCVQKQSATKADDTKRITLKIRPSRLDTLCFVPKNVFQYHKYHYLDYEDILIDGFYDGGRFCNPSKIDPRKVELHREIIVVDAHYDLHLQALIRRVQAVICHEYDQSKTIRQLSLLVQAAMGGHSDNINALSRRDIAVLKRRRNLNVIWLGELRHGQCRHRALLFKYLGDRVGIPSRLVRGEIDQTAHAWNVISINKCDMLLELMGPTPELYDFIGPYAEDYHRAVQLNETGNNLVDIPEGDVNPHSSIRPMPRPENVVQETSNYEHPQALSSNRRCLKYDMNVLKTFWQIKDEEIQYARDPRSKGRLKLGQGGFGVVYLGKYRGTRVAVKQLKLNDPSEAVLAEFRKEVSLLMRLRHPNIVLLLGANLDPRSMLIVTEYVEKQDLKRLIERRDPAAKWGAGGRRIALDIAVALCYLHWSNIVHLDVKSLNILIGRGGVAKLADVGLAKTRQHASTRLEAMSTRGMTLAWAAPELLNGEKLGPPSDIYSFGVCMWEIVTHEIPWEHLDSRAVIAKVLQGKCLPFSKDVDPQLVDLIQSCWKRDPRARPTAEELVKKLELLQ